MFSPPLGLASRPEPCASSRRGAQQNPPRNGDAWHPYVALDPDRELDCRAEPRFRRSRRRRSAQPLAPASSARGKRRGRRARKPRDPECPRRSSLGGVGVRRDRGFRRPAVALLRREVPEQVLPDGGHYERSPVYHLVVLRDLIEMPDGVEAAWLDRADRPDAPVCRPPCRDRTARRRSSTTAGSILAPRLELARAPDRAARVSRRPVTSSFASPGCGCLDCGAPVAALSARPCTRRRAFGSGVVGRGARARRYGDATYEPGPERDRLRSTSAHSTIALDGASQFVPWGAFRAGALPDVGLAALGERKIEARVVWRNGLAHVRTLEWSESAVVVRDRIDGTGRHRVTSRLILAPGPRRVAVTALDGTSLRTEQGIVSERFGQREPSDVLVLSREGELPLEFGWRIECGATP